jgi:hypothetical protein
VEGLQGHYYRVDPEENAYIEALHSTSELEVIQGYWFDSFLGV